eukprot:2658611-Alexandrium_andersonii.AAC.1
MSVQLVLSRCAGRTTMAGSSHGHGWNHSTAFQWGALRATSKRARAAGERAPTERLGTPRNSDLSCCLNSSIAHSTAPDWRLF